MTEPSTLPFQPTWASPPGDTILDLLEERGWTQLDLATRTGISKKHVNDLVNGRATISADAADRLSRVLGSTIDFWLVRDAQYRAALERNDAAKRFETDAPWLRQLPVKWMRDRGYIGAGKSSRGADVEASLRFFGVASVAAWRERYEKPLVAYRASKFEKKRGAVAVWLRQTEREAEQIECAPFDATTFRAVLHTARGLTDESDLRVLRPKLTKAFAAHGVAVVITPAPPGCPVSGATRWLTPHKALLALTCRYRSNDHFWFTVFHEAAHILLHKKSLDFVEGIDGLDEKLEADADRFARDTLIPPPQAAALVDLRAKDDVIAVARAIGVAPGVVVGRMQKEGWLPWKNLNGLKTTMVGLD